MTFIAYTRFKLFPIRHLIFSGVKEYKKLQNIERSKDLILS